MTNMNSSKYSKPPKRDIIEKFNDLQKLRGKANPTLERSAMRGVLNKGNTIISIQEDEGDIAKSIFERKKLPEEVPKRKVVGNPEKMFETAKKTSYEQRVYDRTASSSNPEQMPLYEKNSMSHYDITEGKVYNNRNPADTNSRPGSSAAAGLSWKKKQELAEVLISSVRDFRLMEQKRVNLTLRFDLKLEELFRQADERQCNSLSVQDFSQFVTRLGVEMSMEDSLFLFSLFDKDQDRYLSLEEFVDSLVPFNIVYNKALTHKSGRKVTELGF